MGRGACWVVCGKVESWVVFVAAMASCVVRGGGCTVEVSRVTTLCTTSGEAGNVQLRMHIVTRRLALIHRLPL